MNGCLLRSNHYKQINYLTQDRLQYSIYMGVMIMTEILRWVLILLSIPLIVMFVMHTVRRIRSLSQRIDEYHESQAAGSQKPGPINPYEGLSAIFGKHDLPDDKDQEN